MITKRSDPKQTYLLLWWAFPKAVTAQIQWVWRGQNTTTKAVSVCPPLPQMFGFCFENRCNLIWLQREAVGENSALLWFLCIRMLWGQNFVGQGETQGQLLVCSRCSHTRLRLQKGAALHLMLGTLLHVTLLCSFQSLAFCLQSFLCLEYYPLP